MSTTYRQNSDVDYTVRSTQRPSSKCNRRLHKQAPKSNLQGVGLHRPILLPCSAQCCLAQLSGIPCGEQPATDVCSGCCARRLLWRPRTSIKYTRIVQPVGKLALQVTCRCSMEAALLAQTVTRLSDRRWPAIDLGIRLGKCLCECLAI